MEQLPDRPLECGDCKKPIQVIYTEIVGKMMYRIAMCHDCPVLHQKLYGNVAYAPCGSDALAAGLCCGNCSTTADEVRMGANLGCSICYEVFEDLVTQELASQDRLPGTQKGKKLTSMHIGRIPGQTAVVNPSLKLVALHQALHETLKREDYEQAAWLRDQIKALTEENPENEQKSDKS
jgi:protein arginine kinase activator